MDALKLVGTKLSSLGILAIFHLTLLHIHDTFPSGQQQCPSFDVSFSNRAKGENGGMADIAIQLTMQGMFYGEGRSVAQGLTVPFFRKHRR